jgi:hypothetical protein
MRDILKLMHKDPIYMFIGLSIIFMVMMAIGFIIYAAVTT